MSNPLQALIGNQSYDDLCEMFAEQQIYGHASLYPNAITAWTSQSPYQKSGLQGIQPGDQVFFSPNAGNGNNGHTGIFKGYDAQGNPLMESATDNGVQVSNISNWLKGTGQQLLGYIQTSNPKLKQELTSFANQTTQSLGGWGTGNPAGPANPQGNQIAQVGQQDQSTQNALVQQQKQQQELSDAQTASSWFNQYKQQTQQQDMQSIGPSQAQTYQPIAIAQQPTQAENWLSSYQ